MLSLLLGSLLVFTALSEGTSSKSTDAETSVVCMTKSPKITAVVLYDIVPSLTALAKWWSVWNHPSAFINFYFKLYHALSNRHRSLDFHWFKPAQVAVNFRNLRGCAFQTVFCALWNQSEHLFLYWNLACFCAFSVPSFDVPLKKETLWGHQIILQGGKMKLIAFSLTLVFGTLSVFARDGKILPIFQVTMNFWNFAIEYNKQLTTKQNSSLCR